MNTDLYEVLVRRHFILGPVTWRFGRELAPGTGSSPFTDRRVKVYDVGECPEDFPEVRKHEVEAITYGDGTSNIFRYDNAVWRECGIKSKFMAKYHFKTVDKFIRIYEIKMSLMNMVDGTKQKHVMTKIVGAFTDVHFQHKYYRVIGESPGEGAILHYDEDFRNDREIIEAGIDIDLAHVINI